jgi:hypothetical protein
LLIGAAVESKTGLKEEELLALPKEGFLKTTAKLLDSMALP